MVQLGGSGHMPPGNFLADPNGVALQSPSEAYIWLADRTLLLFPELPVSYRASRHSEIGNSVTISDHTQGPCKALCLSPSFRGCQGSCEKRVLRRVPVHWMAWYYRCSRLVRSSAHTGSVLDWLNGPLATQPFGLDLYDSPLVMASNFPGQL
jgi:hypothetical protein